MAGLTQAMVTIYHSWDNLKLVRAAGWKAPSEHPDLDPGQNNRDVRLFRLYEGTSQIQQLVIARAMLRARR